MQSLESRPCPKFDMATRRIFGLDQDLDLDRLEDALIALPKARRGSVALGEKLFMDGVTGTPVNELLEIGANIGLHSRAFLAGTSARVHSFEPNPRLFHHFTDLIAAGLEIVYRDFQYHGRFNLVAISSCALARPRTPVMDEIDVFGKQVARYLATH